MSNEASHAGRIALDEAETLSRHGLSRFGGKYLNVFVGLFLLLRLR